MRIERRHHSLLQDRWAGEVDRVRQSYGGRQRVCGPACDHHCPSCGLTACRCHCDADCPEAPRRLSSDPARHPIEAGILPLVLELKRLGVYQPCWSCEGHAGADGRLWKLPQVWFRCDSVLHLRLLSDAIKALEIDGSLAASWQVRVGFAAPDDPDVTFSLEPLVGDAAVGLDDLRRDVITLAARLGVLMIDPGRQPATGNFRQTG